MKSPDNLANNLNSFKGYEVFDEIYKRDDIFQYTEGLTKYLHDSKIKDIIFIDSAARPAWVGIDEYWKQKYTDEVKPGMFFVNPLGFKEVNLEEEDPENLIRKMTLINCWRTNEEAFLEAATTNRDEQDIIEDFATTYAELINDKEEPVLIFDTCSHTGETINDVKRIMEKVGFKDIKIITATPPDQESGLENSAKIVDKAWLHHCYPFGKETSIIRTTDSVVSKRYDYNDSAREQAIKTRQEIRHIIKDRLENPSKLII